jgi:ribosomal protein L31E
MEENTATKKMQTHPAALPAEEKKAVAAHAENAAKKTEAAAKTAAPAKKADATPAKAEDATKKTDAPAKKADATAKTDSKSKYEKKAFVPSDKKEEKKREIVLERVCIVNLTGVYNKTKDKRLARGVKLVREYAARHAKAPIAKVRIATNVNEQIRSHGSSWSRRKSRSG